MSDHPIQGLMKTAMEAIKGMIDVNTVIGEAVETQDGGVIIPVSRVSFGFAAGGGEYESGRMSGSGDSTELPFGGGSAAGVSVQPVGFLVVHDGDIRLLPIDANNVVERLIDTTPQIIDQVRDMFGKSKAHAATRGSLTGSEDDDYGSDSEHERGFLR